MQSCERSHVAIIMDGNGRWASERGLARSAGHEAGAAAVRRTVEAAVARSIGTLTLYAFSSDNWRREPQEIGALMRLLGRFLASELETCVANGVRLEVIGRRDRLKPALRRAISIAEVATRGGTRLALRLAVDYSAREAIVRAIPVLVAENTVAGLSRERLAAAIATANHAAPAPDVDLLIRTGGERRLSDFLLLESAYAELYFTPVAWPEFGESQLDEALAEFARRSRRFGGVHAQIECGTQSIRASRGDGV